MSVLLFAYHQHLILLKLVIFPESAPFTYSQKPLVYIVLGETNALFKFFNVCFQQSKTVV